MQRRKPALTLEKRIFLHYSSFASQAIKRGLHIFLYLHFIYQGLGLLSSKEDEEGKACPFLAPEVLLEGG